MRPTGIALLFVLAAPACTFNVDVDVNPPAGSSSGDGSTGLGGSGVIEGSDGSSSSDGSSTSGGSSEGSEGSSGSTGSEDSSSSGAGESTTGDPTDGSSTGPDFPAGCTAAPAMVADRCTCDSDGTPRAIDPMFCGCAIVGQDCACPTELHPLASCGWDCAAPDGVCHCGPYDAPAEWCGL